MTTPRSDVTLNNLTSMTTLRLSGSPVLYGQYINSFVALFSFLLVFLSDRQAGSQSSML